MAPVRPVVHLWRLGRMRYDPALRVQQGLAGVLKEEAMARKKAQEEGRHRERRAQPHALIVVEHEPVSWISHISNRGLIEFSLHDRCTRPASARSPTPRMKSAGCALSAQTLSGRTAADSSPSTARGSSSHTPSWTSGNSCRRRPPRRRF